MLLGYCEKFGSRPPREIQTDLEPSYILKKLYTIKFNSYSPPLSISFGFVNSWWKTHRFLHTKNSALNVRVQNASSSTKFLKLLVSMSIYSSIYPCIYTFIQCVHSWTLIETSLLDCAGSEDRDGESKLKQDWDQAFQKVSKKGVIRMHIMQPDTRQMVINMERKEKLILSGGWSGEHRIKDPMRGT